MDYNTGAPYAQPGGPVMKRREGVSTGLFVGVLILSLCTFIGLVLAAVTAAVAGLGLYGENEKLRSEVKDLAAENRKLRSEVEDVRDLAGYIDDGATQLWIAADMHLRGVTEEFYTDDVVFYADNVVALNVVVQPAFDDHYLKDGRFDVSNAVLREKLGDYVREFERCYDNGKNDGMADFKNLELQISVYGYDVAIYKGGEFTFE